MNITLTGEYACSSARREQCSTVVLPNIAEKAIHIHNVTELKITNLRFSSSTGNFEFEEHYDFGSGVLSLDNIHNLTIENVVLDGELEIEQPMGSVYIGQLSSDYLMIQITSSSKVLPHSAKECTIQSNICEQFLVNVTIFNSTFQKNAMKIKLHDTNSKVSHYRWPVKFPNSSYTAIVHFSHCFFEDRTTPLKLLFNSPIPCHEVMISNCVFTHNDANSALEVRLLKPSHHIEIKNTRFLENTVQDVIKVINYQDHQNAAEAMQFTPTIIIDNCTFANNTLQESAIDIDRYFRDGDRHGISINLGFYGHNTFKDNKQDIWGEGDYIIVVDSTFVGVSGVVEVENNKINVAAMAMSANSKILLQNNSQLRIADNGNSSKPMQFLVYNSYFTFRQFYEECVVDGCDERCVFQFVDDNGMYIAEDDLEYFNASIILSNGGAREKASGGTQPHYLIYNANLQNCTLTF